MYIAKFRLFHYKSFLDSGLLEFKPGINIITGQNNSGKTALLQALDLELTNVPHKSTKTLPNPTEKTNQISRAEVSLLLQKEELKSILYYLKDTKCEPGQTIADFVDKAFLQESGIKGFEQWLNTPEEVELSLSFDGATPTTIEAKASNISKFATESVFNNFKNRIFRFSAERQILAISKYGDNDQLKRDASNLGEVLSMLQSNRKKFDRFNSYVSLVLPQIKAISVTNKGGFEIRVWPTDTDRDDLTFPLSACGTGIGQVLAILYVILTSQEPRTIIIDEPQSFLHPGAEKKLVDVLKEKEFAQHQYFIATHSPTIIANANASTIVMLRSQDWETVASVMNSKARTELTSLMDELGVKLSDIFGADNILWVEGPTEEVCFQKILEKKRPLRGTTILAVSATGDFEQKDRRATETIFKIYAKVSGNSGKESFFPPAIGFIFDKEDRSSTKLDDMKRMSKSAGRLEFIPRRMYENYLLHPKAIASVINEEIGQGINEDEQNESKEIIAVERVEKLLKEKTQEERYYAIASKEIKETDLNSKFVKENIHAANILKDLFAELSETRVEFQKPRHPIKLTEWLLKNEPKHFCELEEFLLDILDGK
ncbi:ATP-dependent nuclease [Floridanema aerugineum]|uniref:ATP-dependent endonuclease n=1 Tax=Floridaenema aerugineum BLCC-F46 TaxID=3153654 RepID=A0ABV4X5Z6_9CYAN